MARTTRKELEGLFSHFVLVTGTDLDLHLDYASAYGGYVIAETLPHGGQSRPFGDRRRSAAEMADVLRFGIKAAATVRASL